MSFRLKIVLGIVLIQALLLVILITISLSFLRVSNEIELTKRANSIVSLYAVASGNLVKDKSWRVMLAETRLIAGQPGVVYARILVGDESIEVGDKAHMTRGFVEDFMIEDVNDGVFDVYADVTDAKGLTVGRVELGLSILQVASVMDAARRQISTIAIIGMAFSVIMAIFLGNYFARQLKNLRDASRSIAAGNIGYQMYMKGDDELTQTANAFNTMSRKLALLYSEKQAALNESEDKALILREKERRLKAILENAGDGIVTIDAYGDIESFNASAERMFGYPQSEVIGENAGMLIDTSFVNEYKEDLIRYLKNKDNGMPAIVREVNARHADGSIFPMELDVSEMLLEGQRLFIAIARDVTQRREAEEELRKAQGAALEAARAKFEFIANISHEIRNPMNGVLTMINLLNDSDLSEVQRDYVGVIHDSGSALITIINDILDFSRLEAGQLDLDSIDFDLEQMIEDVCRLLHANAGGKGVSLVHMIAGNVPTALIGDPARIRQIMVNLVDNAIKFTEQGNVTIHVSVLEEADGDVVLHFAVVDTGIGLSPRAQRCLLEGAEEELAGGGEYKPGSTGLGLAISRKLLQLMGGSMGIDSVQGSGSTFWFDLSLGCQSALVVDGGSHYNQLQGLRALVIDNREVWSGFLKEQMETIDMVVTLAPDYQQGLALLADMSEQDQSFDLVVFDMMIPGSSGLDLASSIRADANIVPLRMIMVATTGYRGDSEEVRRVGITGYLSTPVSSGQLYECITAVMSLPVDDDDTLITRHSLADSRASQREHVLLLLDDPEEQRQLLLPVQGLGYRVHVASLNAAAMANERRHYGCILVDCRGLTPAGCHDRLATLMDAFNAEDKSQLIALIKTEDQPLSLDYKTAGASAVLCWPVEIDVLQDVLNDCRH